MAEPASTATIVSAAVAVPALTLLGIPLGLRPDVLIAGFAGAIAAIGLLNAVPSTGDTWRELLRTSARRIGFAIASSLTAGYLAPATQVPEAFLLGAGFVIGAGAQQALRWGLKQRFGAPAADQSGGAS